MTAGCSRKSFDLALGCGSLLILNSTALGRQDTQPLETIGAMGWIFMILSLVFVWGLTFWCFKRVLADPEDRGLPTIGSP